MMVEVFFYTSRDYVESRRSPPHVDVIFYANRLDETLETIFSSYDWTW